jgi:hypothetical protein
LESGITDLRCLIFLFSTLEVSMRAMRAKFSSASAVAVEIEIGQEPFTYSSAMVEHS